MKCFTEKTIDGLTVLAIRGMTIALWKHGWDDVKITGAALEILTDDELLELMKWSSEKRREDVGGASSTDIESVL